jgi:hypothetical protein
MYPNLGSGNETAKHYVNTRQRELMRKTSRYLLELFGMLEKVDQKRADELRTHASDFRKYLEADFDGSGEFIAFLDRISAGDY